MRTYISRRSEFGFTLIELLVTLTLLGITATAILPLATLTSTRMKESELRAALITIRTALDKYKAAADAGLINKPTGGSGYPPTLMALVTGVPRATAFGVNQAPIVFLRRIPRDPFSDDKSAAPELTWDIRSYGSAPGDFRSGTDVFDVSSKSNKMALDGTSLRNW